MRIGTPRLITATLAYPMMQKERIFRPDLCGGALLDVGVYALYIMQLMDDLRAKWGVRYPMD